MSGLVKLSHSQRVALGLVKMMGATGSYASSRNNMGGSLIASGSAKTLVRFGFIERSPVDGRHTITDVGRAWLARQWCPDGGTCHHDCLHSRSMRCFRVECCDPLSGVFPDDVWPEGS